MQLGPAILACTLVCTAGALLGTAAHLGPGFLLYLAMLGGRAIWLLPAHAAIALPSGLFAGAVLAASGPRASTERPAGRRVAALTIVAALVPLYLVGWGMPAAYAATAAATARFTPPRVERAEPTVPASLDLPQLLADRSGPARAELARRLWVVGACLVMGLLAAGVIASPVAWSFRTGLAVSALVFLVVTRQLFGVLASS